MEEVYGLVLKKEKTKKTLSPKSSCPRCSRKLDGSYTIDPETGKVQSGACTVCGAFTGDRVYLSGLDKDELQKCSEHNVINAIGVFHELNKIKEENFLIEIQKRLDQKQEQDTVMYRKAKFETYIVLRFMQMGGWPNFKKKCPLCNDTCLEGFTADTPFNKNGKPIEIQSGVCISKGAFIGEIVYLSDDDAGKFTQLRSAIWNAQMSKQLMSRFVKDFKESSGGVSDRPDGQKNVNLQFYWDIAKSENPERYHQGKFEEFFRQYMSHVL